MKPEPPPAPDGAGDGCLPGLLFGRHHAQVAFRQDQGLRREDALFPDEAAAISTAVEKRRREFRSGRAIARAALMSLGQPRQPLPVGDAGAPAWPAGTVGSISHCHDEAIAAVARATDLNAIGIDVETTRPFDPALWRRFCNAADIAYRDRAEPTALLPAAMPWANLVFSAKESLLKAYFPLHGGRLPFAAIAIRTTAGRAIGSGRFQAVPLTGDGGYRAFCNAVEGRWSVRGGHVYCSAICAGSPCSQHGNAANPR